MLSRVAERIYWLARYMERAENTARLVNVYSTLLLDLPRGSSVGWGTLIDITGASQAFGKNYQDAEERNVTSFLLVQKDYPGSILNSVIMARENARTTREIMPSEAWELINDLYLYVSNNESMSTSRSGRQELLKRVINSSQQLTGLLTSCMSHSHAYEFLVMGQNLERSDMTSRIVDVGAATLMQRDKKATDIIPYENSLWMNVLRSLNGYQMYRQQVRDRVNGEDVVEYLLLDKHFPRTILHCLKCLAGAAQGLPNNEDCLRTVAGTLRRVQDSNIAKLLETATLYNFIDDLQLEFAAIHNEIAGTWFLKSDRQQSQSSAA